MEPERQPLPPPSAEPPPAPRGPGVAMRQAAIALELPFALAGPVLVGGFLGYLLDHWLGWLPVGMLLGGALGFIAGVREVQRRMKSLNSSGHGSTKR